MSPAPIQPQLAHPGERAPRERRPAKPFSLELAEPARKRTRAKKAKAAAPPTFPPGLPPPPPPLAARKAEPSALPPRELRVESRPAPRPAPTRAPERSETRTEPAANALSAPALPIIEARGELAPAQAPPPVPPPGPEQTLLQLALLDPSLRADVRQNVVQVSLETEAAGPLALEVRMRGELTHVRVDGPASPLVAQRTDELRAVLAREGLSLGNFSSGQQAEREARAEPADAPQPAFTRAPPRVNDPSPRRHEGRIDVEA